MDLCWFCSLTCVARFASDHEALPPSRNGTAMGLIRGLPVYYFPS